ncbi:hypothetical protein [Streptomyces sp. NPDC059850]|uniref:hypothetical protein n=1 Tax=Streptomyces sp. NPDC059850 TaxID=3346970 RepID=UPI00365552C8
MRDDGVLVRRRGHRDHRNHQLGPTGCVAWALPTGQDLDATTLVRALGTWFGQPA